jgi:hypothetical protein
MEVNAKENEKQTQINQQYNGRSKLSASNQKLRKSNPSCNRVDLIINQCVFVCLKQHISAADQVIDLCCGQLGTLPKLLRLGISSYVGFDASEEAIQQGHTRIITFKKSPPQTISSIDATTLKFPNVHLVCLDLNQTTIQSQKEESKAHTVLCLNALHYLAYEKIFNTVHIALLKQRGYFIVLCLDANMMQRHFSDFDASADTNSSTKTDSSAATLLSNSYKSQEENDKRNPYPTWFTIHNISDTHYNVTNLGLIENVTETRMYTQSLFNYAKSIGLSIKSSCCVWDIFKKFSKVDFIPSPGIKTWPPISSVTEKEKNLLCVYTIHVFQKL